MGNELDHRSRQQGAMVTLVERSMGFTMIRKLEKGKDAKGVSQAVYLMLLPYKHNVKTITTDNGPEFADHKWLYGQRNRLYKTVESRKDVETFVY